MGARLEQELLIKISRSFYGLIEEKGTSSCIGKTDVCAEILKLFNLQ